MKMRGYNIFNNMKVLRKLYNTKDSQSFKFQCSSSNIQWDIDHNPPIEIKAFKGYNKPHGPSFPTPASILQLFTLVFTNELVGNIVTETNRYAQFCLNERYESWECVTIEELYAYFGFLILMGMVNLPSIKDYWRKDVVFNYRPLSSRISRTQFLDIHRFLHFVDNNLLPNYGDPNYSKILNQFLHIFRPSFRNCLFQTEM